MAWSLGGSRGREGVAKSFRPTKKLGSPVVPFYPFSFWVPISKPNREKKGTLITVDGQNPA